MVPEKPEVVPADSDVDAVKQQVVDRVISDLSAELGHPLVAAVELVRDGGVVRHLGESRSQMAGAPQAGRLHVRFRSTFHETRKLFLVDAVFERDERSASFGGFTVRGDVRGEGGVPVANYAAWSVKRNDWDWAKWL